MKQVTFRNYFVCCLLLLLFDFVLARFSLNTQMEREKKEKETKRDKQNTLLAEENEKLEEFQRPRELNSKFNAF